MEDWPFFHFKGPIVGTIDLGTEDICRQQIGGKLNPLEARLDRGGQGLDRGRLGQPGKTFEKQMAVTKQTDEHPIQQ